jgi:hypothetical protein
MHKYIILFFSVLLFLASCKGNKAPAGIINHDRMISLLTDIHVADGRLYSTSPTPDSLYKYGMGRYLLIFKNLGTDTAQFKKSLKYYAFHSDEMLAIYDQVMKNLKQKADSLTLLSQKPVNAVPKK